MEHTRTLYVMISHTDTGIGRLIRAVSRYPYNHVALTLDPSFTTWFSFARYARDIPLYGGFISESISRYCSSGRELPVRIFRMEIPAARADRLEALFHLAGNRDYRLIYNTYDAMASALGIRFPIRNAYTCLSFACAVLGMRCRSIRALDSCLQSCLIYDGPLSGIAAADDSRDDAYFSDLGFLRGSWRTARHFAVLSGRVFHTAGPDLLAQYL